MRSAIIQERIKEIETIVKVKVKEAETWGRDLMQNFINGINSMKSKLQTVVNEVATIIQSMLGFSEPSEGPLSNFHTYAPDMMKLFTEGIKENEKMMREQLAKSFDFSDIIVNPMDFGIRGKASVGNEYGAQTVSLLENILDHGLNVNLEGDVDQLFRVISRENRIRTRSTGYNELAMA